MTEKDERRQPELDPTDPSVMQKVRLLARFYSLTKGLHDSNASYDVQQLVLMELLKIKKEIKRPDAYLRVIVCNTVVDYLKKNNSYRETQFDESGSTETDFPITEQISKKPDYDTKILLSEIKKLLNDDERHILTLLIFGCDQKEIAEILNIKHDLARQRVFRLRRKLKNIIFPE